MSLPVNVWEAVDNLIKGLSSQTLDAIKSIQKEKNIAGYHFSLGKMIRNDWLYTPFSKLKLWFYEHHIWHTDDMSSIILKCLWCAVKNLPFNLDDKFTYYKDFWSKNYIHPQDLPKEYVDFWKARNVSIP